MNDYLTSAPSARLFGYFSRKGRKGRKKGSCMLSAFVNYMLCSLTKLFSSPFFFSSLGVLGVLCAFARGITGSVAPKAPTKVN